MTDVFAKLRAGQPVEMTSTEYRPAIEELHRADSALYRLNHTAPRTADQASAWQDLFAGDAPTGVGYMAPLQIDFPRQMTFGQGIFINHHFTAMSIGGIELGNGVQIGPNVTMVTDNHDLNNHNVLRCKSIHVKDNAWIGANVTIVPGVTVGQNAIIAAGTVVTKNVPANTVIGGNPAHVIKQLKGGE